MSHQFTDQQLRNADAIKADALRRGHTPQQARTSAGDYLTECVKRTRPRTPKRTPTLHEAIAGLSVEGLQAFRDRLHDMGASVSLRGFDEATAGIALSRQSPQDRADMAARMGNAGNASVRRIGRHMIFSTTGGGR